MKKKIGIDEAGRGPLAGPLLLCGLYTKSGFKLEGIFRNILAKEGFKDSKKLSVKKREALFDAMEKSEHIVYSCASKSAKEVDEKGLSACLFEAVEEILQNLGAGGDDEILLDGTLCAPSKYNWTSIKKGDEKFLEIALASIVAKVLRDKYMKKLAQKYPNYKFEKHKGYGTKEHRKLILQHGPCPEHRKSFLKNICK